MNTEEMAREVLALIGIEVPDDIAAMQIEEEEI